MNRSLDSANPEFLPRNPSITAATGDMASVNGEYVHAFRTKSYAEMWGKLVEAQVATSMSLDHPRAHLSESLLEPGRETLADMAKSFDLHPLLVEYFDATSNACDVYELLLQAVPLARAEFRMVKDAITLAREELDDDAGCRGNRMSEKMREELSGYARLRNSLSVVGMDQFRDLHDGYAVLLRNLVNQHHRMNRRRTKLSKVCKKIVECAPLRLRSNNITCSHWGELDVAAKLLYVQINDMDTVSSLVGRLQDNATRDKSRAAMAAGCDIGDLWKEIVKGLGDDGRGFKEQLEELEERICLCFLTINKSRLSVVREIMNDRN